MLEGSAYWKAGRVSRRSALGRLSGAALGLAGLTTVRCSSPAAAPTAGPAPTVGAGAVGVASPAASPAAAATQQPKRGGTLKNLTTSGPKNLDPHVVGGASTVGSTGPLFCYSTLVTFKWGPGIKPPSYIPIGDLAESWTQPDELTYIFKLRPGAKFHNIAPANGRAVVAEDVIYSYNRARDLKAAGSFLVGISKMEAPENTTLKLTLDRPNADLLSNLATNQLVIVAKERADQTDGKLDDMPVIGSGPFVADGYTPNEHFTAKRNPDYYMAGLPYVDGFDVVFNAEGSNQVSAFRTGAANIYSTQLTVPQAEEIIKAVPGAYVDYVPRDRNAIEIMLNPSLDLFKDVRVRQAISKAIDRKAIVDTVYLGRGGLTTGLSVPDPSYNIPDAEFNQLVGRDVEGAKKLLKDAGKDTGLSFEILAPTYQANNFVTLTELIQANLKDVGINTTIKTADTTTWAAAQGSGNFQALTGTFQGGAPNGWLSTRYYTGGGQNWVKYSDPTMDKLIDQQFVLGKDPEARKKVIQDIERKIINDAVYVPLILYYSPIAARPEIRNYYVSSGVNDSNIYWITVWVNG